MRRQHVPRGEMTTVRQTLCPTRLTNAGPFKGPKQFFHKTDYNPFLKSIKPSTLALLTVRCNFAEHTYAAQQCRNLCCSRPRTGRLGRDQLRDAGNVRVGPMLSKKHSTKAANTDSC